MLPTFPVKWYNNYQSVLVNQLVNYPNAKL